MADIPIEVLLTEDHDAIDVLFDAYLQAKAVGPREAAEAFERYSHHLEEHMLCEEEVIPAALERLSDRERAEMPHLFEEHDILRTFLARITKGLLAGTDCETDERLLYEELHEHNGREEIHMYPHLDALLSLNEKRQIDKKIPL